MAKQVKAPGPSELFGARVREEREARKWSLDVLAEKTGIDSADLSRIETGRGPESIGLKRIDAIAQAFGVPIASLLEIPASQSKPRTAVGQ